MQVNSNAIHVNPDRSEFIGGEVITQDQAVAALLCELTSSKKKPCTLSLP